MLFRSNPFIDPLTIARDRDPYPHKLKDSCNRHGIVLDNAHSALADVYATMDLVIDQHDKKDITEWLNVAGYRPKYGLPEWYPEHAILRKQGAEVVKHVNPNPKTPRLPKAPVKVVTTSNPGRKKTVPDDPKNSQG